MRHTIQLRGRAVVGPISTPSIRRVARFHQGTDRRLGPRHKRALLSSSHARHVDRRLRLAGLAHNRNSGAAHSSSRRQDGGPTREKLIDEFKLPKDAQRIDAPTPYVWIIGRIKTDGPQDTTQSTSYRLALKITPLSQWGKTPEPVPFKPDPTVDMKTPPKLQVDRMPAGEFFAYAAELLKLQPPHLTDQPIIARLTKIGIEPDKNFDIEQSRSSYSTRSRDAPQDAQKLMKWKVRSPLPRS